MKKRYKDSTLFKKKLSKLKGQDLFNIMNKIEEILNCQDINHYKNLKYNLKKYKRVHVNNSYVILFFGEDEIVYFVDYEHHNNIYKYDKKQIMKYENLKF
jgi:mRNA-degrading endonuclease RelE of RelBE toxin-antitoxin system